MVDSDDTSQELSAELLARQSARQDKVIAFLKSRWGDQDDDTPCPYCGVEDWYVDPVPIVDQRVGGPVGTGLPAFVVLCQNCGNQVYINANIAGVFDELWHVAREETTTRTRTAPSEEHPDTTGEQPVEPAGDEA